ncbi:MAG: hypothetical protein JNK82_19240 [Myxococcaceae bacterium]|nr:hypothetical protein [Myxococcaceae bacterium]
MRLPHCATTGIGSLPHTDVDAALRLAFAHDVPFVPQLPRAGPGELMVPSALEGLPGLVVDGGGACTVNLEAWRAQRDVFTLKLETALSTGELTSFEPGVASCRSFRPFLREVESRKLPFAKVQLAGPATVRQAVKTDFAELERQIFRLLLARSLAMAKAVRRAGATPIVFIDEPGLEVPAPSDLEALISALQREGALVGLHCCRNTSWGRVLTLGLDVLSIDARLSLDALLDDAEAFGSFISAGSTLALGIVPTDPTARYALGELIDSVEVSLRATAPKGFTLEALLAQTMLTPACGLALHEVRDAERIAGEVREAQRLLLRASSP